MEYNDDNYDYSWVTDEMFDEMMETIAHERGTEYLLSLPGVHEIVSEDLNNQILDRLRAEKGPPEPDTED